MSKLVSTQVVIALLVVTSACVNPKDQYDDFTTRVVDAAPRVDAEPAESFCASTDQPQQFYLTMETPLGVGKYIHYIADITVTGAAPDQTIDLSLAPLDFETREHVDPPVTPNEFQGLPVDPETLIVTVPLIDVVIPGRANPLIPGAMVTVTEGEMAIRTPECDLFCGDVSGRVVETGSMLDGSTVGTVPITPGTIGGALPTPRPSCEAPPDMVDAGVPDAGIADAGVPDAAP